VPRFQNLVKQDASFLRGYHYGGSAGRGRGSGEASIGVELKESLSEPGAWRFGLYGFGECLPYADNRVTLNHTKKDKWGRPVIAIDCEFKENEKKMHEDMGETAAQMLDAAGFKEINVSNKMSFPGNANHEMGVARMGRDPKTSVLNAFNQMHEVKNVFITDGSCITSGSCLYPSITYMALTARACDHAVKELKRMNL
jgi:choline dehydrogenase-like flavoprotein